MNSPHSHADIARGARPCMVAVAMCAAAGVLLAAALMLLLPEAVASGIEPKPLLSLALAGLVLSFLVQKAKILLDARYARPPAPCDRSDHPHGFAFRCGRCKALAGDAVQAFVDGILLVPAFSAGDGVGCLATSALLVHAGLPHLAARGNPRSGPASASASIAGLCAAGAFTALGGASGCWLAAALHAWMFHLLALASGRFIYVALSGFVPQLKTVSTVLHTVAQVASLLLGILVVAMVRSTA